MEMIDANSRRIKHKINAVWTHPPHAELVTLLAAADPERVLDL